jgi:glutathione synthase/RimK-type ligase-like ATP-grasp enzyme
MNAAPDSRATPDLVVIHEHPEWQKPLFVALDKRGVAYDTFDVTRAVFDNEEAPRARLYFNQASPSAYVRGHARAVPLALAYMRSLELKGARVLNGSAAFALELSKSTQATLLHGLGIETPRSLTFNDPAALRGRIGSGGAGGTQAGAGGAIRFPALLKPDQGGSGARIQVVDSLEQVEAIFERDPSVWLPDNLFLLQELLPHDPDQGIIRLEFLGGELLYAMRVKTHGQFNLCPSPVCNPDEGGGHCAIPDAPPPVHPVEFYPYFDAPPEAIDTARRIVRAAGLDVGGIEYLETTDGRRVFYDINANSNLRPSIAEAWGFDPFERVVDYLTAQIDALSAARV